MLMWHMWHVLFLTSEGLRIHELRELTGNGDIGMTLDEIVIKLHSWPPPKCNNQFWLRPLWNPFIKDLWIEYKQVVSTTFLVADGQRQHCPFTCHTGQTSFCHSSSSSDYDGSINVSMICLRFASFFLRCLDPLVQTNSSWAATVLSKDAGILRIHGRNIESNRNARHQSTFSQALQIILWRVFTVLETPGGGTHLQRSTTVLNSSSSPQFCAEVASLQNDGTDRKSVV